MTHPKFAAHNHRLKSALGCWYAAAAAATSERHSAHLSQQARTELAALGVLICESGLKVCQIILQSFDGSRLLRLAC